MSVDSPAVLVVEDQLPVLEVVERTLVRAGFVVIPTASADQALAVLQRGGRVDLLLSDVVMPQMDGLALAMKVRELRPGLAILFMTGYSSETVADRLCRLRDVATIEKPFRPADLVRRARELLAPG